MPKIGGVGIAALPIFESGTNRHQRPHRGFSAFQRKGCMVNLSVPQQPAQNCVLGPGLHVNKWGIRFQPPPVSPCRRRLPLQQKYHHSTLRLSHAPCRPGRGFRYRIYRYPWVTRSLGAPTGQGKSSYPAHLYSLVKVHERLPLTILLGHFFRKTKADSQHFSEILCFAMSKY